MFEILQQVLFQNLQPAYFYFLFFFCLDNEVPSIEHDKRNYNTHPSI